MVFPASRRRRRCPGQGRRRRRYCFPDYYLGHLLLLPPLDWGWGEQGQQEQQQQDFLQQLRRRLRQRRVGVVDLVRAGRRHQRLALWALLVLLQYLRRLHFPLIVLFQLLDRVLLSGLVMVRSCQHLQR